MIEEERRRKFRTVTLAQEASEFHRGDGVESRRKKRFVRR